jgi:hypothetical protein
MYSNPDANPIFGSHVNFSLENPALDLEFLCPVNNPTTQPK